MYYYLYKRVPVYIFMIKGVQQEKKGDLLKKKRKEKKNYYISPSSNKNTPFFSILLMTWQIIQFILGHDGSS